MEGSPAPAQAWAPWRVYSGTGEGPAGREGRDYSNYAGRAEQEYSCGPIPGNAKSKNSEELNRSVEQRSKDKQCLRSCFTGMQEKLTNLTDKLTEISDAQKERDERQVELLHAICKSLNPMRKSRTSFSSSSIGDDKPAIQVSVRILDIPGIKVDLKLCNIDCLICLDWPVKNKPGVNFPDKPEEDWTEEDWDTDKNQGFYNPSVTIENFVHDGIASDKDIGVDQVPRFDSAVDDNGEIVWMKKTMRFSGNVSVPSTTANASKFPFDIHTLIIRMRGDGIKI